MSRKGRFLSNIAFLGVGTAISKLTVFFLMPLYTASLGPADFGTVDVLVNTAVLLLPLASLGAPEAIFRFVAGGAPERESLAIGRKMLTAGLVVLILVLPFLGFFAVLRPYLIYLFFYVSASVLRSYLSHLLRAKGHYGVYALQQAFCTLTTVLLAVLFLRGLSLGVRGYLLAVLLSDAVTALMIVLYLGTAMLPKAVSERTADLRRRMLRYAIPLIPTATMWWALSVSDRYFLLYYHGEAANGIYAAAAKLPALLTFATGLFLEAWHFTAIREGEEGRQRLFERIYGALLPMLVLFVAFLILFARPLVGVLFAADFASAALFVPFLAISALFSALSSFLGSVYVVKLRSGNSLLTALVGVAVNVVLDLVWIPLWGTMGAVAATFFSYAAVFLWRAVDCRRVMPFRLHAEKLLLSTVLLFVTARVCVALGAAAAAPLALLAILVFWRELIDVFALLLEIFKKITHNLTKKRNLS